MRTRRDDVARLTGSPRRREVMHAGSVGQSVSLFADDADRCDDLVDEHLGEVCAQRHEPDVTSVGAKLE